METEPDVDNYDPDNIEHRMVLALDFVARAGATEPAFDRAAHQYQVRREDGAQRFTACAFWQANGTGYLWCLNDGRVVSHDWVADGDPRLFFSCREAAQAAITAARKDGRISKGMRVIVAAA